MYVVRTGENIWKFNKNTNFIGLIVLLTGYVTTKFFLGSGKGKKGKDTEEKTKQEPEKTKLKEE